jgi:DUF971 family protein
MATPAPTEVEYKESARTLVVRFEDGTSQSLCCEMLRGFCPCARCQGHGGGPPRFVAKESAASVDIVDVYPIGNYALGIHWKDGHDTGIYSFDLIRRWPTEWQVASMEVGQKLILKPDAKHMNQT